MLIIRSFEPSDAKAISALIGYTMRISNSADYPLERLQPLIDYFSPEKLCRLNRERICLVAELDEHVVGTIAVEHDELLTFFVHPDYQHQGIGSALLANIEDLAAQQGIMMLHVESSLTAMAFYEHHDYQRTGVEKEGSAGRQIFMEKEIDLKIDINRD